MRGGPAFLVRQGTGGASPSKKAETAARCGVRGASSRGRSARDGPGNEFPSSLDVQSARAAFLGKDTSSRGQRPGRSGEYDRFAGCCASRAG
jgi:hypothetical protein